MSGVLVLKRESITSIVADPIARFPAATVACFDPTTGELPRRQLDEGRTIHFLERLAQAGAPCAVKLVHASRGKRARAEPIAALYEQGRVTHCGAFVALEEELLALGVSESEGLLDRADALVWALTDLMLGPRGEGPRIRGFGLSSFPRGLSGD